MLKTLTERLTDAFKYIRGQSHLTEDNIKNTLREVRIALLEADVALPVVQQLINQVREKALNQKIMLDVSPAQAFIKLVHDDLVCIMGENCAELNLATQAPAVILVAGLQGSGKTSTVAKLAYWLKKNKNQSVLVASTDIYRPAAIKQLETLANEIDVKFHPSDALQSPVVIATSAIQSAKLQFINTVIIDTAGRLHVDTKMMEEIKALSEAVNAVETLLVIDSMIGQDAVHIVEAFNSALPLTGIILTKMDGDSRGGVALSTRFMTGKPIKFVSTGEKVQALEAFYPDRIASRILGMGDIVSLVEEAQRVFDQKKSEKLAKKLNKGKKFDLNDFLTQLQEMKKMGGISTLLDKLPNNLSLSSQFKNKIDDQSFIKMEAMIYSMTPKERRFPDTIRGSHKRRITAGSGTQIQDLNRLLRQFTQMQKMAKKFFKPGAMDKLLRGLQGQGQLFQ